MLLRALILGICFSFFGGFICEINTVQASNTGTEKVEQNRKKKKKSSKKKTYKKKSSSLSSFGQAYHEARKKGLKTFKWNGKTYTTEKDTDSKKNITSKNKKTKRESASYKNVSFGSAYKDAKRKGLSTFTWNGKKYTTESKGKTKKKKYTKSKRKSKKKYSRKKKSSKKRYTKKKSSNKTYKTNTYTPPPNYNNDNSGREYKRESNNNNAPVKKEPKKD